METNKSAVLGILRTGTLNALTVSPGEKGRIKINVCGRRFEIQRQTVLRYPTTRLGRILLGRRTSSHKETSTTPLYDDHDRETDEFYFERNPAAFEPILVFYTTGTLHIPRHLCVELFQDECDYWGIPFVPVSCCQGYHQQEWEISETVRKTNDLFESRSKRPSTNTEYLGSEIDLGPLSRSEKLKRRLWDLFENSDSSRAASIVSIISSAMVIISTITLCVNTHPDVKIVNEDGQTQDNPKLLVIEIICIFWFTLEYIIRIYSSPSKKDFLCSVMNTIDLLAILPFYIGLIVENLNGGINDRFTDVRRFVQILRIFRIVRIFKVARHSTGLQVLGYTVRNSGSELGLLFMLLLMGMTLFSSLVYYAEEDVENTKFVSIIAAFWWAIITMTTVGYGDMYPVTTFGQIIGSMCCVSGILFIALPIPTIVSNFSAFYKDHLNKGKLQKLYEKLQTEMVPPTENGSKSSVLIGSLSSESLYNVTTLKRVSLTTIERRDNYRRRLSTVSGPLSAAGSRKVCPLPINENA